MTVYRITLTTWAEHLVASGRAARWNGNGFFMVYTSSTRALACLENIVHRRSLGNNDLFRVMVIDIPDGLRIDVINRSSLPAHWTEFLQYAACQGLGDRWLQSSTAAVLRVPSAIIPEEFNYLINPQHPDFKAITIKATEPFSFDDRLMDPGKR